MTAMDPLYGFYTRELESLRGQAVRFAKQHDNVAKWLELTSGHSKDPHVERLIQAVAFLAARVQQRLDDDYPQFAEGLLSILYPHYLTPMPAATIVQFELGRAQGKAKGGVPIDRGTAMETTARQDGRPCTFRTVYPVQMWPIRIERAEIAPASRDETQFAPKARAVLRLAFTTVGGEPMHDYDIASLRLHLGGEERHAIYSALFKDPQLGFVVRIGNERTYLPADRLRAVGFRADEGLYDHPPTAALGYRLLQEYFALPDKFMFAEISGLSVLRRNRTDRSFEVVVLLGDSPVELEGRVNATSFRLGCTPVVNLFRKGLEPIHLDPRQLEYRVQPESGAERHFEVHSIQSVATTRRGQASSREFRPFFAMRHGDAAGEARCYWHLRRVAASQDAGVGDPSDHGTNVWLRLVDEAYAALDVDVDEIVHVEALCTNRDRPRDITFGKHDDFVLQGVPAVESCRALRPPTPTVRPALGGQARWRLVSHLAINHLSLVETGQDGTAAFRELLRLYDFEEFQSSRHSARRRVEGLHSIACARETKVLPGVGPVRGALVDVTLDESAFAGDCALLFATVLKHFLDLFTTINSFTHTRLRLRGHDGVVKDWPPAARGDDVVQLPSPNGAR